MVWFWRLVKGTLNSIASLIVLCMRCKTNLLRTVREWSWEAETADRPYSKGNFPKLSSDSGFFEYVMKISLIVRMYYRRMKDPTWNVNIRQFREIRRVISFFENCNDFPTTLEYTLRSRAKRCVYSHVLILRLLIESLWLLVILAIC